MSKLAMQSSITKRAMFVTASLALIVMLSGCDQVYERLKTTEKSGARDSQQSPNHPTAEIQIQDDRPERKTSSVDGDNPTQQDERQTAASFEEGSTTTIPRVENSPANVSTNVDHKPRQKLYSIRPGDNESNEENPKSESTTTRGRSQDNVLKAPLPLNEFNNPFDGTRNSEVERLVNKGEERVDEIRSIDLESLLNKSE